MREGGKGILKRVQTRQAANKHRGRAGGMRQPEVPLEKERKNRADKKQNPVCQAEDSRLQGSRYTHPNQL